MTTVAPDARQAPDDSSGQGVTYGEARQVAEAARQTEWAAPSFVKELFEGRVRLDAIHPYPRIPDEELERAEPWLTKLDHFLAAHVDADEIDRTYKIPAAIIEGLKELGCFGIKIPQEYGGLGFSQAIYNRAIAIAAAHESSIAVLLSAHQSIGVPQPLKTFGTPAQKEKYLPRLAKGAISAFALTEPDVGSDPARMTTTAEPTLASSAFTRRSGSVPPPTVTMATVVGTDRAGPLSPPPISRSTTRRLRARPKRGVESNSWSNATWSISSRDVSRNATTVLDLGAPVSAPISPTT